MRWFNFIGKKGEVYSTYIDEETGTSGCSCPFMSFFVYGKKFKGKVCCHIKRAREMMKNAIQT